MPWTHGLPFSDMDRESVHSPLDEQQDHRPSHISVSGKRAGVPVKEASHKCFTQSVTSIKTRVTILHPTCRAASSSSDIPCAAGTLGREQDGQYLAIDLVHVEALLGHSASSRPHRCD